MVTLSEIAERANVSVGTVSRVLSRKTKEIWPSMVERADRIRRIARELGYRPNSSARAVSTGRFGCATLLSLREALDGRSRLQPHLIKGLVQELEGAGMHLNLAEASDEELADECRMPKVLREAASDGLFLNYTHNIPAEVEDMLSRCGAPIIWLNRRGEHDCVFPDDERAGRVLTEHLLGLGHRRIGYLNTTRSHHYSQRGRYEGYASAMSAAGLPILDLRAGTLLTGAPRDRFRASWLALSPRPTALITYSPLDVTGVALTALEAGVHLPLDLSLATFHEESNMELGSLSVTLMQIPFQEVGVEAVRMLIEKVASPELLGSPRACEAELIAGTSTTRLR